MPVICCGAPLCVGCGAQILERQYLVTDKQSWHDDCLCCCACGRRLEQRCFVKDDKVFCDDDFYKQYGVRCVGCTEVLKPHELVRRVRDKCYHLACFRCACCTKELSTGDQLYVLDDKLLCQSDYHSAFAAMLPLSAPASASACSMAVAAAVDNGNGHAVLRNESVDSERTEADASERCTAESHENAAADAADSGSGKERPASVDVDVDPVLDCSDCDECERLDSPSSVSAVSASEAPQDVAKGDKLSSGRRHSSNNSTNSHGNNNNNTSAGNTGAPGTKRRGPRTTIKAKQLDTLKNAFSATPKPSRHIREQLAAETGLNMRVIQVWFQNRRSKERRMKQLNAMGLNRRMLFNRGPRRLRALRAGLDPSDPMMAMLESGAAGTPNIDVSHHLSSLTANQGVAVRPYDYFAAPGEHMMPPPHSDYMLGLPHGMSHPAQQFTEYYPSASCNAQVFMETNSMKSEVFSQ